jgi:glycogen(starch) synthase
MVEGNGRVTKMKVLMTTDAVGGVWQYSLTLARGLAGEYGCRVLLVCFGEPDRGDLSEWTPVPGIDLIPMKLKLEWMPDSHGDVQLAVREIGSLVKSWRADVLHSNQFCFGRLDSLVSKVVVAHSDLLSWLTWHRQGGTFDGDAVEANPALRSYRQVVATGLGGATSVVTPTKFMANALDEIYGCPSEVIPNGLWPDIYHEEPKTNLAVVAGRLWDEAKQAATAVEAADGLDLELQLIGSTVGPTGEKARLPEASNARYVGVRRWHEVRAALAPARYYLATSSYEPFGLSALEAGLCGCAILANDIPSFREVWGDAALFYRRNDAADLRANLSRLIQYPEEAARLGKAARTRVQERFGAQKMVRRYYKLYQNLY